MESLLLIVKHLWGHTPNFEAQIVDDKIMATGWGFRYNKSITNALEKSKIDKAVTYKRVGLYDKEDIENVLSVISEINSI